MEKWHSGGTDKISHYHIYNSPCKPNRSALEATVLAIDHSRLTEIGDNHWVCVIEPEKEGTRSLKESTVRSVSEPSTEPFPLGGDKDKVGRRSERGTESASARKRRRDSSDNTEPSAGAGGSVKKTTSRRSSRVSAPKAGKKRTSDSKATKQTRKLRVKVGNM